MAPPSTRRVAGRRPEGLDAHEDRKPNIRQMAGPSSTRVGEVDATSENVVPATIGLHSISSKIPDGTKDRNSDVRPVAVVSGVTSPVAQAMDPVVSPIIALRSDTASGLNDPAPVTQSLARLSVGPEAAIVLENRNSDTTGDQKPNINAMAEPSSSARPPKTNEPEDSGDEEGPGKDEAVMLWEIEMHKASLFYQLFRYLLMMAGSNRSLEARYKGEG